MTDEPIYQALEVLRKGGIILYPTDTVWGIGCDATNDEAVERIYRLKRSGEKKSMLVLLDNPDKVSLYIRKVPDIAWQLYEVADKPLTLILPGACAVAENLIPEEGTLGIRIPEHEFCKKLIRKLNLDPFLSVVFPAEACEEAFAAHRKGLQGKVLMEFQ